MTSKFDLKRLAGWISDNNLWSKSLSEFTSEEIESLARAVLHIHGSWSPELARIINWLEQAELPGSFQLNRTVRVTDGEAFRRGLLDEVAAGPNGPRTHFGALQADLRKVYQLFGPGAAGSEVPF